jgi:hypothetical protein
LRLIDVQRDTHRGATLKRRRPANEVWLGRFTHMFWIKQQLADLFWTALHGAMIPDFDSGDKCPQQNPGSQI